MTGEHQNVDAVQRYELKLSFHELSLIHKSLLATKSLGVLSQEDKLIDDTIQLVGQSIGCSCLRSSQRMKPPRWKALR